jgi:hypothetical protein
MFAMMGLLMRGNNKLVQIPESAYMMADDMLEARKHKEVGIKTVKRTRKTDNET